MAKPLPRPVLATRRLVLRTFTARDADAHLDYLAAERRDSARWAPLRPREQYTASYWRRAARTRERDRRADRGVVFLLFLAGEPRRIAGVVSLSNVVRGAFQACHLGYSLRKEHEGKGLMTEALRAVIPYAFGTLRLHRVMANHMPANRRSARVLRRLGFRREGLAPEYLLIAGRWEAHVLNSLVNPRWTPTGPGAGARAASRRSRPASR